MKKNSFVEGTIIASLSLVIVKALGAVYVIPFYDIVGELGGALYSYAYTVYSLVLNICTAGIPLAISKIVSEYNALEMYDAEKRTLKIGNKLVMVTGSILFLATFIFSKELAYIFIGDISGGNTIEEVSLVIKSISFCLLIVPLLAVKKGYLQGQKYITPTTTSQLIEQIVRIAFVLFSSYLSINILNLSVSIGVATACFGSFFAGLTAYIYLNIKIKKNKKKEKIEIKKDKPSNKEIFRKIVRYSLPLIVVVMATDIYNMTDIALINRGLSYIGYSGSDAETVASVISTWGSKICMLVNAIATGLSITLIPNMVSSLVKKDHKSVNNYFVRAIGIVVVVGLPLSVGLSILSNELYTIFYGYSEYGNIVLKLLPFSVLLTNTNFVINSALQSLNKFKTMYLSTIIGLTLNAILDIPLILLCDKVGIYPYYGAIFATMMGSVISLSISMRSLRKSMNFRYKTLLSICFKSLYSVIIMGIIVYFIKFFIDGIFASRISLLIPCVICAIIGMVVYFFIIYKNNLLYEALGKETVDKILSKIRLKK